MNDTETEVDVQTFYRAIGPMNVSYWFVPGKYPYTTEYQCEGRVVGRRVGSVPARFFLRQNGVKHEQG